MEPSVLDTLVGIFYRAIELHQHTYCWYFLCILFSYEMLPKTTQWYSFRRTEATWTSFLFRSSVFLQTFHCHSLQLLQISWTCGLSAPCSETVEHFTCGVPSCQILCTGLCSLSIFRISFSTAISHLSSFWKEHGAERESFSNQGLVGVYCLKLIFPNKFPQLVNKHKLPCVYCTWVAVNTLALLLCEIKK